MELFIFIGLSIAILGLVAATSAADEDNSLRKELENDFPEAKIHVNDNDKSFLVIDFDKEQIVVGLQKVRGTIQEQPYRSEIPFSRIVRAEILKDGIQVASTNRGSQVLGAAVGTVAFGVVGAIIGGLSGTSTSTSSTKRLSIQITADEPKKPVHEVTFYESDQKKGGRRGKKNFDQVTQQVVEFAAHIEAAIRKVDSNNSDTSVPATVTKSNEEITKQIGELWRLKEIGALTQDEFENQKKRIINYDADPVESDFGTGFWPPSAAHSTTERQGVEIIDKVWNRLISLVGEKTGKPFTFTISGEILRASRTNYDLGKDNFEKVIDLVPFDGPGVVQNLVFGPSYVWAIMHDPRVRKDDF